MKSKRLSRQRKTQSLAITLFGVALIAFAGLAHQAFAYGPEGHRIVGAIADELLQGTPTGTKLQTLLEPGETLASVATWADQIKGGTLHGEAEEFVNNNPNHKNYHFSDVPFQIHHYSPVYDNEIKRGVNSQDLEHMMQTCIHILRGDTQNDLSLNPTHITPHVALKLLVHYVGDMHQPLHVGAGYIGPNDTFIVPQSETDGEPDAGGNHFDTDFREAHQVNVRGVPRVRYRAVNLHHFWDSDAVVLRMQQEMTPLLGVPDLPEQYGRRLAQPLKQPHPTWESAGDPITWPIQWATDILPICDRVHQDLQLTNRHEVDDENDPRGYHINWSVHLSPQYVTNAEDIVQLELQKGGYCLAKLLTVILP